MGNSRFKFRFWDKEINQMRYGDVAIDNEGCPFILTEQKKLTVIERLDNIIPLQSTGLKDKNGKLIYEADVIVIPNQYPFYDYKNEKERQNLNDTNGEIKGETILNYVGIVEYIFNGWQYVLNCVNPLKRGISNGINYHLNEQGFEEYENSCYEVIGNKFENPELLKECE